MHWEWMIHCWLTVTELERALALYIQDMEAPNSKVAYPEPISSGQESWDILSLVTLAFISKRVSITAPTARVPSSPRSPASLIALPLLWGRGLDHSGQCPSKSVSSLVEFNLHPPLFLPNCLQSSPLRPCPPPLSITPPEGTFFLNLPSSEQNLLLPSFSAFRNPCLPLPKYFLGCYI